MALDKLLKTLVGGIKNIPACKRAIIVFLKIFIIAMNCECFLFCEYYIDFVAKIFSSTSLDDKMVTRKTVFKKFPFSSLIPLIIE